MSKLEDKYLKKEPPMTEEEKDEAIRRGKYAGLAMTGAGGLSTGIGAFNLRSFKDIHEAAKKLGISEEEVKEKIANNKKLRNIGIGATAGGLAIAGSLEAYKHYKDKKSKSKKEGEKTFASPADAQIAFARVEAARVRAASNLAELSERRARQTAQAVQRAQRIEAQKQNAVRRGGLTAMTNSLKSRAQSVGLFKSRSTVIRPVSMG